MARSAAIDTHVLVGVACGTGSHKGAVKILREKMGFDLKLPPAVLRQLMMMEQQELLKLYASDAVELIDGKNFEPLTFDEADRQIIENRIDCLVDCVAIEGANKEDYRVLVESSYLRCDVLLTTNPILTDADTERLSDAVLRCDIHPIVIRQSSQIFTPKAL